VPAGEGGTSRIDGDASAPGGGIRPDRDEVALAAQSPRSGRPRMTLEDIHTPNQRVYEPATSRIERDSGPEGPTRAAKSL